MADAFRLWGNPSGIVTGPVSNPILVSGSGPTPPVIPIPPTGSQPRLSPPPAPLSGLFVAPAESSDAVTQLLGQLGEIHSQMFTQFHQSLVLMVQLFGCLGKDQLPAMQKELSRIQELTGELTQLQGEVARRAAEVTGAPAPARTPPPRVSTSTPTPLPEPSTQRSTSLDSTALQHWVMDRINSLQQERQSRWQSLVGMFTGKNAG
jgi:hypothetical protein